MQTNYSSACVRSLDLVSQATALDPYLFPSFPSGISQFMQNRWAVHFSTVVLKGGGNSVPPPVNKIDLSYVPGMRKGIAAHAVQNVSFSGYRQLCTKNRNDNHMPVKDTACIQYCARALLRRGKIPTSVSPIELYRVAQKSKPPPNDQKIVLNRIKR